MAVTGVPLGGGGAAPSQCLAVAERSQVGEARRLASALAQRLGFPDAERGRVALAVTELATNLVKHTPEGGEIVFGRLRRESADGTEVHGIEVLALDRGAGIGDVARALHDGHSTAGSAGTGLGAVRRASAEFDLYSRSGQGTAVLTRFWAAAPARAAPGPGTGGGGDADIEVGALRLPHPGETACGDAWAVVRHEGRLLALVADGLGHGALAGEASEEAARIFRGNAHLEPVRLMEAIHAALRSTRGGVAAIAEIDPARDRLVFVGVGNIAGTLHADGVGRSMASHNGTLGQQMRKAQPFTYPWSPGSVLVLHSDGMSQRWDLARYPGLSRKPAALIAGVLYRDFTRHRDDVAVLVVKGPDA